MYLDCSWVWEFEFYGTYMAPYTTPSGIWMQSISACGRHLTVQTNLNNLHGLQHGNKCNVKWHDWHYISQYKETWKFGNCQGSNLELVTWAISALGTELQPPHIPVSYTSHWCVHACESLFVYTRHFLPGILQVLNIPTGISNIGISNIGTSTTPGI